mmetsp:Transcript_13076/g.21446  ORF Transcript_13076/g.21446 Transcript_13076/m.21446 type:complete len:220 (-) Transcript_13076:1902-2561(-)
MFSTRVHATSPSRPSSHIRTLSSSPNVASSFPSGDMTQSRMEELCALERVISRLTRPLLIVSTSQIFKVESHVTQASSDLAKATALMGLFPQSRVARHRPDTVCHTRTVRSHDPDTITTPSGEKTTELTLRVWPFSVDTSTPVRTSHTFNEPLHDPDTSSRPFFWNAQHARGDWSCSSTLFSAPVSASYTLTVPSLLAVTICPAPLASTLIAHAVTASS